MSKATDDATIHAKSRAEVSPAGKESAAAKPAPPKVKRSAAANFQDLAASGEFPCNELREAIDGLDLLSMSRTDPHAFALIAKEVGANVRGLKGPEAVLEVVRAIMSGKKRRGK